jgi:hypothetical protein
VGHEAIEDGGGGRHVSEKHAPVLRGSIRRNECRRGSVAADEDLLRSTAAVEPSFFIPKSSRTSTSTRVRC